MARIWLVREGAEPTRDGPLAELVLAMCRVKFGLTKADFLSTFGPRFGKQNDKAALFQEPRYVVIELSEQEARANAWKPGFYLAPRSPNEARRICTL